MQALSEVIAPQLFAASLFPYLGFLFHLTRGQSQSGAPKLMVFGFYFLLVFVFATIPAGMVFSRVHRRLDSEGHPGATGLQLCMAACRHIREKCVSN